MHVTNSSALDLENDFATMYSEVFILINVELLDLGEKVYGQVGLYGALCLLTNDIGVSHDLPVSMSAYISFWGVVLIKCSHENVKDNTRTITSGRPARNPFSTEFTPQYVFVSFILLTLFHKNTSINA